MENQYEKVKLQVKASEVQLNNRKELLALFKETPVPIEQLMVNLPMYIRSSALAKLLYINELYELMVRTPGVIMEFGVWWGANLVLFENLRAVYEPYNYTRKIIGFDTFDGYASISENDGDGALVFQGNYNVSVGVAGGGYTDYLTKLLEYHRSENTMSNIKKYELVKGDATKTVNTYFEKHPETIIALAYFDMQLYTPTKSCLEAIVPYLTKGSVIAMDELNAEEFPGETIAFKEIIGLDKYRLVRSKYLPDRTYLIVE
jgi:hypothetical protein